ncbi:MAG: T9SS type A sorting domain-containing protein [Bacteroidales bacterium]|nr:T9SS type A sorting domain-containing protein [Bacteroidales bacterium]
MKKYIIIVLILIAGISSESQVLSVSDGVSFSVQGSVTLTLSDGTDFINDSQNTSLNGNIEFIGSGEQIISGTVPLNISNMYIDNSGLLLENDVFVSSELNMQNGIINLQSNNLTVGNSAVISGNYSDNCMVVSDASGVFIRNVSGNGTYLFPVGDIFGTPDYSPAEVDMLSGNYTDADIRVSVFNEKHSQNNSTVNYLNRYWQVSATGITNPDFDITLDYVPGDVAGNEAEIFGALYTTDWLLLNQVSNSQITANINKFGDFTGGEQYAFSGINELLNNEITVVGLEDGFRINLKHGIEILQMNVFNVLGQEVYQQKEVSTNIVSFNRAVKTGIYFIRLLTNKGIVSKKVLIH